MGAVITEGQEMRCQALFLLLNRMLEERKTLFAGANYLQYIKTEPDAVMPRIVLVIDNFASFQEKTDQRYYEDLRKFCKEGTNAGITLLLTCGGISSSELPTQLSEYFADAFCLELKDRYAYGDVLGSVTIPLIPDKGIRGRGLTRIEERMLEFQTALAVSSPDDYERMRQISAEAKEQRESYAGPLPVPVKSIPERFSCQDMLEDEETKKLFRSDRIPLGYHERTMELSSISLEDYYCFVITGRRKSGKHTFMRTVLHMLKSKKETGMGTPVSINIIDFKGTFSSEAKDPLVDRYFSEEEALADYFEELALVYRTRKEGKAGQEPIYVFLIENLSRLLDLERDEELGISAYLEHVWDKGAGLGVLFIGMIREEDAASITVTEACRTYLRYATGVHLGGNLMEDVIFDHGDFSYQEQTEVLKAGRGYLFSAKNKPEKILTPETEVHHDSY